MYKRSCSSSSAWTGAAAWWLAAPFVLPALAAATAAQAGCRRERPSRKAAGWCPEPASKAAPRRGRTERPDIVETASSAGAFSTLVEALKAADLVETLQGEGPFTVFAPTDDAFDKLPKGALDKLLKDKGELTKVLTYHVVPGRLNAADLAGVEAATTVEGGSLAIDTSLGVKVGSAYVVQADIACSNGVVHAIDAVLLPE